MKTEEENCFQYHFEQWIFNVPYIYENFELKLRFVLIISRWCCKLKLIVPRLIFATTRELLNIDNWRNNLLINISQICFYLLQVLYPTTILKSLVFSLIFHLFWHEIFISTNQESRI